MSSSWLLRKLFAGMGVGAVSRASGLKLRRIAHFPLVPIVNESSFRGFAASNLSQLSLSAHTSSRHLVVVHNALSDCVEANCTIATTVDTPKAVAILFAILSCFLKWMRMLIAPNHALALRLLTTISTCSLEER